MGTLHPFPRGSSPQIGFTRAELGRIIDLYGRMVAAGMWKDYALEFGRDHAAFWAFRRTAERPEYRIEKRPALRNRQGMWALVNEAGMVLRRGHELGPILSPLERRLMKVVNE
ncbi:MAG TPA: DUF2794 domain-containing protein [Allosphingosinicella sp.]|nr:DUF2794 domain-containing protein [Allosphingosinicella sp.]